MTYVLYNPLSGNGEGGLRIRKLREELPEKESSFIDVRAAEPTLGVDFSSVSATDRLILAGGDGTLHRFLNIVSSPEALPFEVYLFPTGVENRFYTRHMKHRGGLLLLNDLVKKLPQLTVGTEKIRWINGVGVGLDTFVREEIRKNERLSEQPMSPRTAHVKGMLLKDWSSTAQVRVDGEARKLQRMCFLSVTMDRRTEGGLLLPRDWRRTGESCAVLGLASLPFYRVPRALHQMRGGRIPSLLEETWHTEGRRIEVKLSSPQRLAVDGELLSATSRFEIDLAGGNL